MKDAAGSRRKLIVFTEHRDTLDYLVERIGTFLGRPEAIVAIHGGLPRDQRRAAETAFKNDPAVVVLVATDAAGEGINLQRAHLMVNYDLPWNPNRIEQRFGRIHRIGQTEPCHLWNLVAHRTREGDVYARLLQKIAVQVEALSGTVFDVLGELTFEGKPLRQLLIEAIRLGDSPEVRAAMTRVIDDALDVDHLRDLLATRALGANRLDTAKVAAVRDDLERAEANRLQPHYVRDFFLQAYRRLGGAVREREPGRYELTKVPGRIRDRAREAVMRPGVLGTYERIAFEKDRVAVQGLPLAEFVCPGHPLLEATIDLVLQDHRELLRRGALLVDETDPSDALRVLVYLEHAVVDGRPTRDGHPTVVSRRLEFVELGAVDAAGAGAAPTLTTARLRTRSAHSSPPPSRTRPGWPAPPSKVAPPATRSSSLPARISPRSASGRSTGSSGLAARSTPASPTRSTTGTLSTPVFASRSAPASRRASRAALPAGAPTSSPIVSGPGHASWTSRRRSRRSRRLSSGERSWSREACSTG